MRDKKCEIKMREDESASRSSAFSAFKMADGEDGC